MVSQEEHSGRTVTTIFLFKALQTCKGPLKTPKEKVNSREESSLEKCFQTIVLKRLPEDPEGE